jgi:hypothetical protein
MVRTTTDICCVRRFLYILVDIYLGLVADKSSNEVLVKYEVQDTIIKQQILLLNVTHPRLGHLNGRFPPPPKKY